MLTTLPSHAGPRRGAECALRSAPTYRRRASYMGFVVSIRMLACGGLKRQKARGIGSVSVVTCEPIPIQVPPHRIQLLQPLDLNQPVIVRVIVHPRLRAHRAQPGQAPTTRAISINTNLLELKAFFSKMRRTSNRDTTCLFGQIPSQLYHSICNYLVTLIEIFNDVL